MQLEKLITFSGRPGPLLLIVMDGVGLAPPGAGNAVALADTPTLDRLCASNYQTRLGAHGTFVGLATDDEMGNSEVGHNTLGGGRVFDQGAKLVQQAFIDESIFAGDNWREVESRGARGATVHFIGLLSDGNVHSHIAHLFKLLARCHAANIESVCVHALLDGRDVAPRSALHYLAQLENKLSEINRTPARNYRIASGGGRMAITMDRYQADWAMVKTGFDAHVHGVGARATNAAREVQRQYDKDAAINDQYLSAFVIADANGEPVGRMHDGDAVVLFNFRGDRAVEISRALEERDFKTFARTGKSDATPARAMPDIFFCGMAQYDGDLQVPKNYLVAPPRIEQTMIEFLCAERVNTFAVSETQKFGHVTYFWNGNRSGKIDDALETWIEIPSDDVEFSRAPAMKAVEITDATIELMRAGRHRFGRINFANGDMVGHSGDIAATVRAIEVVDRCIARLIAAAEELGGAVIVTADHGNADEMLGEQNGEQVARTAHSLNPVLFAVADAAVAQDGAYHMARLDKPGLANVAATVFNLLGYRAPPNYQPSLIEFGGEPRARRELHRGASVNLGLETVKLPNDEMLAMEIVRHPGGAVVIARDEDGMLCLLRQFRHAGGGWLWEFPAGRLESGETPLATAKRELYEETGWRAGQWRSLGSLLMTPGFCDERLHIFLATDLTRGQPAQNRHEFIEVFAKSADEITAMARAGEIEDAKTIAALFKLQAMQ